MKLSQQKMVRLGMVLAGIVVLYVLFNSYSSGKTVLVDKAVELGGTGQLAPQSDQGPYMTLPHGVAGNAVAVSGLQGRTPSSQQTYSETTLGSSELLPKGEIGATYGAISPASADDLKGQNFLQAGYHSNINVIGISQTNRNASWDLRTENPNPQAQVGPFLQTTISPDPFKKTQDGLGA